MVFRSIRRWWRGSPLLMRTGCVRRRVFVSLRVCFAFGCLLPQPCDLTFGVLIGHRFVFGGDEELFEVFRVEVRRVGGGCVSACGVRWRAWVRIVTCFCLLAMTQERRKPCAATHHPPLNPETVPLPNTRAPSCVIPTTQLLHTICTLSGFGARSV